MISNKTCRFCSKLYHCPVALSGDSVSSVLEPAQETRRVLNTAHAQQVRHPLLKQTSLSRPRTLAFTVMHADECSGITAECLHDDIHSQKPGTSCKHITEGSECEFGTCKGGICSSPTEAQQPQPQQEQQLEQPEADEGDYDDTDVDGKLLLCYF